MTRQAELRGEEIAFPSGWDRVRAHLVDPTAGRGPAIVLVPDVHGLSDLYREIAGRFAARGLAALVVDLYSREGPPTLKSPAEAMAWIAKLPDPRILGDLQASVDFLGRAAPRPIGITGFCMGGMYALLAACSLRGIEACVSFYGMLRYAERSDLKPKSPLDAAADLSCPYLGIFGAEDALIPAVDVEELRARLLAAKKDFEILTYPGCGHAFLNHNRTDAYRPEAAAQAFERSTRFFEKHLVAK